MLGMYCVDCTPYEAEKVQAAETRANQVIQSKCFYDFMTKRGLVQTNGKTPEHVVLELRNREMDVPVHYYFEASNVVGYRVPPNPDIYFNRYFHDNFGTCATASNAAHEWSHSIGYGHDVEATARRPYSVPYSINAAFTQCCTGSFKSRPEQSDLHFLESAEQ